MSYKYDQRQRKKCWRNTQYVVSFCVYLKGQMDHINAAMKDFLWIKELLLSPLNKA